MKTATQLENALSEQRQEVAIIIKIMERIRLSGKKVTRAAIDRELAKV